MFIDDLIGNALEEKEHYAPKTARLIKNACWPSSSTGWKTRSAGKAAHGLPDALQGAHHRARPRLYETYIGAWGDATQSFRVEGSRTARWSRPGSWRVFAPCNLTSVPIPIPSSRAAATMWPASRWRPAARRAAGCATSSRRCGWRPRGPIECIGPRIITLQGGCGGFYLRSKGPGEGRVRVYYREELVGELHYTIQKEEETC
ncbi:MAG: hypothetical protein ACLU9S_08035 [Oscillospiraceae bacterium]